MTDRHYMQRALHLALKAKGKTSPNPMVGAVIVRGNRIIAEGWHHRCGADHAEIAAIKKAGRRARGARLYVTLEPCGHYGRTPPCVDQIIQGGIKEVIMAMKDPNPLTNGKSIVKLRRAGIKVKVGVLRNEAARINEAFIKYIKYKMPFVVAKCAQTLDGKIATATGHSHWITSPKARQFARSKRDEFDAILVGINTVINDNPRLSGHSKTKRLKKIVLDSALRIPLRARLFAGTQRGDCIVATTKYAPPAKKKLLQKKGITIIRCPQCRGQIDLPWLLKELAKREITSILMEGGAQVIGSALKDRLVDKMHVYVAPKIIGDHKALNAVVGVNVRLLKRAIVLKNITFQKIDSDLFIAGYV